jgi:hypothetical protein
LSSTPTLTNLIPDHTQQVVNYITRDFTHKGSVAADLKPHQLQHPIFQGNEWSYIVQWNNNATTTLKTVVHASKLL